MPEVKVDDPPIPNEPFLDRSGVISQTWYDWFSDLWERTGGPSDNVNGAAPIGSIVGWASSTAPEKWLICDGSAVSRSTYSDLFGVIGVTFGSGDGSTTFNLPDGQGRNLVGSGTGSGLSARVIGETGGQETVTLTIEEMPSHNHDFVNSSNADEVVSLDHNHDLVESGNETNILGFSHNHDITDPGHDHANPSGSFVNNSSGTEYVNTAGDKGTVNPNTANEVTNITIDEASALSDGTTWDNAILGDGALRDGSGIDMADVIIGSTGNSDAHENMPPFLVVNVIIRAT